MRRTSLCIILATLAGCAAPLPAVDPAMAWIDMHTFTGRLVMSDKVDGVTTPDGRYFQVSPGSHKLQVRYDYEYRSGGIGIMSDDLRELTCFIELDYDGFTAGQRYRLEVRSIANSVDAMLYDAQRKLVAEEDDVRCL
jgi:hypothetical protein